MIVQAAHSAVRHGAAGLRLCLRSVTSDAHNRLNGSFATLDLTSLTGTGSFWRPTPQPSCRWKWH
jgi:hypothetical protein